MLAMASVEPQLINLDNNQSSIRFISIKAYSGEKPGVKPSWMLQDVLASLVDLDSSS